MDNNNKKINTLNIDNGGSLFRIFNKPNHDYNLSSDTFGGDDSNDNDAATQESLRSGGRADDLLENLKICRQKTK